MAADDIADVVTKVLLDDAYNGSTVTVTGPEQLTFAEAIAAIAQGLQREIKFIPISIDEFKAGMKGAGLPDNYVWLLSYLFQEVLGNPDNQHVAHDVEKVLNRKATDFEAYVKKTLLTGVWKQEVTSV